MFIGFFSDLVSRITLSLSLLGEIGLALLVRVTGKPFHGEFRLG